MAKLDVRAMALLATAHVADDLNQSFIPALLPFLIVQRNLTHAEAGTIVLAASASSSIIQPAIGLIADRRSMPYLIALGMILAGCGVAAVGWAPTMPLLFLAAMISGVGVAIFHPEAARFANYVAGDRKTSGMRWFAAGGNVGFAIGPVFATAAIAAWGLRGTLAAAVPVLIVGIIVILELPRLHGFVPAHVKRRERVGTDDWRAFSKLTAFVIVRSMAYFGFVAFLPLYVVEALHGSPAVGDVTLTAFLVAGVCGTLAGGPLADRYGRKAVMIGSQGVAALLTFVLVALTHGGGLLLALPIMLATGFAFVMSQAAFVVAGQEYLPNRLGLASGVTLGLAVSLGGAFSPVLGWIADRNGIAATILAAGVLSVIALAIALTLPSERARRAGYRAA